MKSTTARLTRKQYRRRLKARLRGFIQPLQLLLKGKFPLYLRYRAQKAEFLRLGGRCDRTYVVLEENKEPAGTARGHYFHQDLLVASFVYRRNPVKHIDVGSRVDGLVAHIAAFRQIEVFDVRPLTNSGHENIKFRQADLMNARDLESEIADSISSLHALEHFGLGRYGDPIDPKGYLKGFNNLLRLLKPGGHIYVSFPIGKRDEVHFNAHRVFHPQSIFTWADPDKSISLVRFDYIDDLGVLHKDIDLVNSQLNVVYGCGVYTFQKNETS